MAAIDLEHFYILWLNQSSLIPRGGSPGIEFAQTLWIRCLRHNIFYYSFGSFSCIQFSQLMLISVSAIIIHAPDYHCTGPCNIGDLLLDIRGSLVMHYCELMDLVRNISRVNVTEFIENRPVAVNKRVLFNGSKLARHVGASDVILYQPMRCRSSFTLRM